MELLLLCMWSRAQGRTAGSSHEEAGCSEVRVLLSGALSLSARWRALPLDGGEREVKGTEVGGKDLELRGVWSADEWLPAGHLVLHRQVSAAGVPGAAERF